MGHVEYSFNGVFFDFGRFGRGGAQLRDVGEAREGIQLVEGDAS